MKIKLSPTFSLVCHLPICLAALVQSVFAAATLETSFNPPLTAPSSSGYSLGAIAADGTYFFSDDGKPIKVSSSGVVDTTYNPPVTTPNSGFFNVKPLAGNALLLTGNFRLSGSPVMAARLLASGAVDPAFAPVASVPAQTTYDVQAITLANGDLLLNHGGYDDNLMSSSAGIKVVRPNGQVVAGFPPAGPQSYTQVQGDGKLMVSGYPLQVNGQPRLLARYGTDYLRDTGFNAPAFNYMAGSDFTFNVYNYSWGYFISLESFDGSDVTLNSLPAKRLYRLQLNGSLVPGFTPWAPTIAAGTYVTTYLEDVSVNTSGSGRVLMQSEEYADGLTATRKFYILNAESGAVDTSFNPTVLTGSSSYVHGEFAGAAVRLSVEDATHVNGQAVPGGATSALLGPTGAVTLYESEILALIEGVDPGNPGVRSRVSYMEKHKLSDGSTLITRTYPDFTHVNGQPASGILRMKADGTWDSDFVLIPGYTGNVLFFKSLSVHEDGNNRLLLTGNFSSINGVSRPGVARVIYSSVPAPAQWTATYNLPSSPAALSSTDSDVDGVVDLLELAFRLHPRQVDGTTFTAAAGKGLPAAGLQPGSSPAQAKLRLTYPRRRDRVALGLTYQPLFSSALLEAGTAGVEISATPADATWEIVIVEDPVAAGGSGRRFAKVRVGL